jgi:hypothetical protein
MFIPQMICEYGEPQWNDTDKKSKGLGEKPVSVPIVHHKSHMD